MRMPYEQLWISLTYCAIKLKLRNSSRCCYTCGVIFELGELFCGPGGIALGATKADIGDSNWRIVHKWATDYDADTCETYRDNICPDNRDSVVNADIRELEYKELENRGSISGFAFGFPCNDFSIVGGRAGINGEYGQLYTYGVKALRKFKPKWFLAENVGGIRHSEEKNNFQKILGELRGAGYTITPHLYKFEEYGIPQARHRVIIVGILDGEKRADGSSVLYRVPAPSGEITTAKEALSKPIPPGTTGLEKTRQSDKVVERLSYIKPGENAFNANIPEHLQLKVKGAKLSQIYRKLDPNKPSYTVTGSGGGGTHMYHWEENRALTNRERARLQTFPDDYDFTGSKESVRKQIGMAVPPEGAQIIFEAILKSFKGEEYPSIEASLK